MTDLQFRKALLAIFAAGSLGLLLVLLLTPLPARSRDLTGRYANSTLKPWFDSLKSGKGPCCDLSDGKRVDDADWESHEGRYRVRIDGEWVDVADDELLTVPNMAGHTMVWPMYKNGRPRARCFIAGPMT